jgi:DNA-binding transcriptional LysR family regulator
MVRSGTCEIGFTWAVAQPDDLDTFPVCTDPSLVVVPEGHRLVGQSSVKISDLRGERMVAPLTSSTMRPVFDQLFHRHGIEPEVVAEAATNEMVLELVRAGVGCTVTFASSAAPVLGRSALGIQITDQPPNTFMLLIRSRQEPTPAAHAFCDVVLGRRLAEVPPSTFIE